MAGVLPTVRLYVGFTSPTDPGNVFTVGHPTLGQVGVTQIGAADTWTEIPQASIRSWSIRYGSGRGDDPTLRYDAASCAIVLNDGDRRFDPDNLAGPYVSGGESQVQPMRRVKLVATWAGVDYNLFYGLADDWKPDYEGSQWTTCTLTATDAFKIFAKEDRTAGLAVGGSENSGARVGRILDAYGWSSQARNIATGDTTLQATTLEGNMLAELLLVQDTEGGELYMNRSGQVVFRNRKAMILATRSTTSQALFGDHPSGYAISGELPYLDVKPTTPDEIVVNSADVSRVGGTEQHVEDATSISRYLVRSHTRDDLLMETDAGAASWAGAIIYQYGQPPRRFARLSFNRPRPQEESALWPKLLGAELGDRITVRTRPAGGGSVIERDCFVRGVEMSGDSVNFETAFVMQGADRYAFFVVGDPIYGRVGLNAVYY